MADNRCNEMSSSSSPTTSSSSPLNETNSTSNSNESKPMNANKNSLNAPKYGTPVPNRVFVGGIPTDTKESEVEQLFSRFGAVVSVKIINDRAGVPRGYGFVTFESEEDANKVMKESDNLLLKNRKLNVSVAIKKQQHFPNDFNPRVITNGSVLYNPYTLVSAANPLYPEFGLYTSDGIPFYNMGISPQLMANNGLTSPSNPYPYTYHTSGLYLTSQPSMTPQMATHYQTSPSSYPLVSPSFRLPITSQNMSPNLNVNQMNPYLQLSNTTTPPLSQPSSVHPIQVGSVANPVMASDNMTNAINAVNSGMSSLNLIQPQVFAISSNIPNSSQAMACVQNVQLKADTGIDMCSDTSHMMSGPNQVSPQMLELMPVWPQRVANIQSPNKSVPNNRNQYSSKLQPNNSSNDSAYDRGDRRSANSSSNTSHNRKLVNSSVNRSKPNGVGYGHQNRNSNPYIVNAAENQCQTGQNHNSIPNSSALQGMPFVKTYYNNRYHTIPVTQQAINSCPPVAKFNSTGVQQQQPLVNHQRITKLVNGVEIYAMPNMTGNDVDCYGYSKTPPPLQTGPNNHQKTGLRTHHK